MAKRLVLTTARSDGRRVGRAVGDRTQQVLLLERPMAPLAASSCAPRARRSSLSTTSSVAAWWVAACGHPAQRPAVDDQGHVDDVAVLDRLVALQRELRLGLGAVVEQPFQAPQLALGIRTVSLGDVEVLALDDDPHGSPPDVVILSLGRRSAPSGRLAAPSRAAAERRAMDDVASALARDGQARDARRAGLRERQPHRRQGWRRSW